ncbi:MAG TPA: hypothetical protein VF158_05110 [Longimicrobiales bacterium]
MRNRTNIIRSTLVIALPFLAAGCGDRGTDTAAADDSATADTAPAGTAPAGAPSTVETAAPRPDTIRASISLEGTEEPMTFWLYRSTPEFPIPFTTYVPVDMAAEPAASAEGQAIRFVAEFGGIRNEQAFLAVAFPPAGLDEAGARGLARAFAARYEIRTRLPDMPPRYPWSIEEWDFTRDLPGGSRAIGTVALGRHGDRYFYVATHFPVEYADGFGPRAARILAQWRWEDTGEPLGGEATGR